MFVLFALARKALWVDHLIFFFGGGGGGRRMNWFVQDFFSHWPMFLFTVKAVQDISFSQISNKELVRKSVLCPPPILSH